MPQNIDYEADSVETAVDLSAPKWVKPADRIYVFVIFSACLATALITPFVFLQWRIWGFDDFLPRLIMIPLWYGKAFQYDFFSAMLGWAIGLILLALLVGTLKSKNKPWKKVKLPLVKRKPKGSALHGTAGWARWNDLKNMALLPPKVIDGRNGDEHKGVFVGAYQHEGNVHYLRHNGPEHVLAFAPTRSGKGVGLVLPTLYTWDESVLVHDPKGECYALTSGFRTKHLGQKCFNFDPANPNTDEVHAYNPLAEVRVGTSHQVADAQNIATILVDPEGAGLKDHWDKTSQALTAGLILHICLKAKAEGGIPTFAQLAQLVSDPDLENVDAMFEEMKNATYCDGRPHPMVAQEAQVMLNKEEREKSSVLSTVVSNLGLYRDPAIIANTSRSDWRVDDLMQGDTPTSCYLVVRPSDADRIRPLIRLICTQIVRRLTKEMTFEDGRAKGNYKHRLLLLLDEFTALRKLDVIEHALAYMAGYGIKCYLIVQDIEQLKAVYGKEETVISNCLVRVCFAPNKIETAKTISEMAGKQTVVHKSADSGKGSSGGDKAFHETSRDLITAEEAMRLRGAEKDNKGDITRAGALLVFVSGHRPIFGQQVLYFKDPRLNERSRIPPPRLELDDPNRYDPSTNGILIQDDVRERLESLRGQVHSQWDADGIAESLRDLTPVASRAQYERLKRLATDTAANGSEEPLQSEDVRVARPKTGAAPAYSTLMGLVLSTLASKGDYVPGGRVFAP